jgi:ribosomal protein S18 acetylase RimI-like enzyme
MQIRAATIHDCDALGLVIVTASWSTFLGRIPEKDFDFSWTPEISAANWRKSFEEDIGADELFYVAEEDGQVVGFVWAEAGADCEGLEWHIGALYILPSQHRKGIGRALLAHVAKELSAAGVSSLEIGCVKENPSCDFYKHLGGIEMGRRPNSVDRYQTEEILFGWRNIKALIDERG